MQTTARLPRRSGRLLGGVLLLSALAACATTKTPTLMVESLKVGKVAVTGAGLDLGFRVQNPNAESLLIERFEYELRLNGHSLGRGYHSEAVQLEGFKADRVDTRFNLNFLRVPGAVKEVLDADRAKVEVKGSFYVRKGEGLKKLGFENGTSLDLKH
jgi:LEA14-like dessication related protein